LNGPSPADLSRSIAPAADSASLPGLPADATATGVIRSEPVALRSPLAHLRFWLVAGIGLAADLWTKEWAVHTFRFGEPPHDVIPYVLQYQTMFNSGALFGIGQGQTGVFLIASLLALSLVLWMFAQSPPRRWLMQIALGAIFAGALGNLYDRVFVKLVRDSVATPTGRIASYFEKSLSDDLSRVVLIEYPATPESARFELPLAEAERLRPELGYVRDFIKIPTTVFGRELWPWVFNIADMLLVCGVSVLAIRLLLDGQRAHEPSATAPAA
jgi:signal peptidase II